MAQSDFERMQELIELLNHCRYEYFDLCKIPPTVSNEEYDKLMQELAALQTKTKIYMSNSPALFAQHKTVEELRKGHHPKPIPIAAPAKQMEDLLDFQMQKQLMLMPKMISVPVKITYMDAQQREIATCGDGIEGYDITHNFCSISGIPFIFNRKETVVVLGEVFMTPKDFEQLTRGVFHRARNPYTDIYDLIYDSVHLVDSRICRKCKLQFVAMDVLVGLDEFPTKAQKLAQLTQYGFTVLHYLVTNRPLTQQQMEYGIRQLQAECLQNGLPFEGVTLQYNDTAFSAQCGTPGYPGADRVVWMCDNSVASDQKAA